MKNIKISWFKVKLSREVIKISPVSTAIISHVSPSGRESKIGYVRLSAFSQVRNDLLVLCETCHRFTAVRGLFIPSVEAHVASTFDQTAAAEMESSIQAMEDQGVQSYILDLRNNPVRESSRRWDSHAQEAAVHLLFDGSCRAASSRPAWTWPRSG